MKSREMDRRDDGLRRVGEDGFARPAAGVFLPAAEKQIVAEPELCRVVVQRVFTDDPRADLG